MTLYLGQPEATKTNWAALQDTFKERYFPQEMNRWKQTSEVWSMKQKAGQSAIDYMACVEMEARRTGIEGDQLGCVIIQGLLPSTRQFVVTREGNDIASLRKWLTVSAAAAVPDLECGQRHPKTFGRDARQPSISNRSKGKNATKECVAVTVGRQSKIRRVLSVIVSYTRQLGSESFGVCQRRLARQCGRRIAKSRPWSTFRRWAWL